MADNITIKQGEAKTITFTVTDEDGVAVNLEDATLTLGIKKRKADTAYAISKADGDFGKAGALGGIVTVAFTTVNTNIAPGIYIGELKASWGAGVPLEKSVDFFCTIERAIIPAV